MFIRAFNWVLQVFVPKYFTLYSNHLATSNSIYALFSTILPVVAQMASLIFGLMRPKKADELKEDVPLGSSGEQDDYDSETSESQS